MDGRSGHPTEGLPALQLMPRCRRRTTTKAQPMALRDETPKVGVYIDFENLHATFADAQFGDGSYRDNRIWAEPTQATLLL